MTHEIMVMRKRRTACGVVYAELLTHSNDWEGGLDTRHVWLDIYPHPAFTLSHITLLIPLYSNQRNYKACSPTLCHRWYNELNQRFRTQ